MVHPSSSNPHKWDYEPREIKVYSLINGQLSIAHSFKDTNARYGLKSGQIFLGRIDNVVFYWVNYDPRAAFWRKADEADGHRIRLPSKVVDIYGVTKGVHRSYGLVIFRKSSGRFSYAPYEHTFWEFDLKAKKDRAP